MASSLEAAPVSVRAAYAVHLIKIATRVIYCPSGRSRAGGASSLHMQLSDASDPGRIGRLNTIQLWAILTALIIPLSDLSAAFLVKKEKKKKKTQLLRFKLHCPLRSAGEP